MDYNTLLDLSVELGYQLAMNGAETYRIEESVSRTLATYGVNAEVFAIPNCLHVSMETPDGTPLTRMRRIGNHGNNMDTMETYSNISRKVCAEKPELAVWSQWLNTAKTMQRSYNLGLKVLGGFLVGIGYCMISGGWFPLDMIWAGICGAVICLVSALLDRMKVNPFFSTIASAFFMALVAYTAWALKIFLACGFSIGFQHDAGIAPGVGIAGIAAEFIDGDGTTRPAAIDGNRVTLKDHPLPIYGAALCLIEY